MGTGDPILTLHVHWEVLAAAFPLFEKMKWSNMVESSANLVAFKHDLPSAWRILIDRVYPPFKELDYERAMHVVSRVDMIDSPWLNLEVHKVLSSQKHAGSQTPA